MFCSILPPQDTFPFESFHACDRAPAAVFQWCLAGCVSLDAFAAADDALLLPPFERCRLRPNKDWTRNQFTSRTSRDFKVNGTKGESRKTHNYLPSKGSKKSVQNSSRYTGNFPRDFRLPFPTEARRERKKDSTLQICVWFELKQKRKSAEICIFRWTKQI